MTSPIPWRAFVSCLWLLVLVAAPAFGRTITDSAGRQVDIPESVSRVFAAGPPASTLLYVVAPEKMIGWVRAPSPAEMRFLLPSVRTLPELGRLTGRGNTLSLERLIAAKPDLIVDFGTISDTYRSLADRVQTQTGIPYLLIDGRFENTATALRLLSTILGVEARGAKLAQAAEDMLSTVHAVVSTVPAAQRPRIYLARGPDGLETGTQGSINTEIIEYVGGLNVVAGLREKGGIANVSPEQIIAWGPDTIITLDRGFQENIRSRPAWRPVPAVSSGRVFLAPAVPFGFIDAPPSVNRLIGLSWLLHTLYPANAPGNLRDEVRSFYRLFYQVALGEADLDSLLAGSGG